MAGGRRDGGPRRDHVDDCRPWLIAFIAVEGVFIFSVLFCCVLIFFLFLRLQWGMFAAPDGWRTVMVQRSFIVPHDGKVSIGRWRWTVLFVAFCYARHHPAIPLPPPLFFSLCYVAYPL